MIVYFYRAFGPSRERLTVDCRTEKEAFEYLGGKEGFLVIENIGRKAPHGSIRFRYGISQAQAIRLKVTVLRS